MSTVCGLEQYDKHADEQHSREAVLGLNAALICSFA